MEMGVFRKTVCRYKSLYLAFRGSSPCQASHGEFGVGANTFNVRAFYFGAQ
jgi:hypothetical protein